jgi:hypothetical protein
MFAPDLADKPVFCYSKQDQKTQLENLRRTNKKELR